MADRYRGYSSTGRSATFNPARTSLPSSIGYTSLYAGDMHVIPSSSRHSSTTPRGYTMSTTSSAVPTTTRTYAVSQDPRSMRPTTRDVSRHRSSTLDSATHRPPVIVMTTQGKDRPHAGSSHSNARSGSPIRDEYRASEGQFYTQPASTIRSRSHARPFNDHIDSDEYARIREHSNSLLRDEPYRGPRSSVIYPSNSRYSSAVVDYGDDGYQYTNAGELARYDLDHTVPVPGWSRKRESFDRGYYRPNVNYHPDRGLNANTNPEPVRNYNSSSSRHYEGRTGAPPSSRYDKHPARDYYDASRDVPPAAPAPPEPTPAAQIEVAGGVAEGRRPRPVSLYQEAPPRSTHHDDYYRSRDDERTVRELRDREHNISSDRAYEIPYFHDDRVAARGFGIRTDTMDDYEGGRDRRREYRSEEPKKRSDEELPRESERDERRRSRRDSNSARRERRESKRGSEDDEKERSRFRDKMAAGLGIAATAMGLAPPAAKNDDNREKEKGSRRRKGSDEDRDRRGSSEDNDRRASRSRSRHRDADRRDALNELESRDRRRRESDPRKSDQAVISASDSDDAKKTSRRHRNSSAFNPNDASDLKQLKEQLAAMKISEKDQKEKPVVVETTRTRSASPTKDSKPTKDATKVASAPTSIPAKDTIPIVTEPSRITKEPEPMVPPKEEPRGRDLVVPAPEEKEKEKEKQVRVVSPPREKKENKPIKGILKQPSSKFPEDPNPIREGVAPHKEDKKIKEAPPGAKWTRISRKVVNPEALTIGKERFEVRDDFVIVLRVLSKEEIQAYAAATQLLRERRRQEEDGDPGKDWDRDEDERSRHHRHRRHRDDDEDRERRRRHRDDDDYESRPRDSDPHHHHHHHHRPHRDRDSVVNK